MRLSDASERVLQALRDNAEGCDVRRDGTLWATVYLDNARPAGMSKHVWAGHLSALERAGLYKPLDGGDFGEVATLE